MKLPFTKKDTKDRGSTSEEVEPLSQGQTISSMAKTLAPKITDPDISELSLLDQIYPQQPHKPSTINHQPTPNPQPPTITDPYQMVLKEKHQNIKQHINRLTSVSKKVRSKAVSIDNKIISLSIACLGVFVLLVLIAAFIYMFVKLPIKSGPATDSNLILIPRKN